MESRFGGGKEREARRQRLATWNCWGSVCVCVCVCVVCVREREREIVLRVRVERERERERETLETFRETRCDRTHIERLLERDRQRQ